MPREKSKDTPGQLQAEPPTEQGQYYAVAGTPDQPTKVKLEQKPPDDEEDLMKAEPTTHLPYTVISAEDHDALVYKVQHWIAKGYLPHGAPFTVEHLPTFGPFGPHYLEKLDLKRPAVFQERFKQNWVGLRWYQALIYRSATELKPQPEVKAEVPVKANKDDRFDVTMSRSSPGYEGGKFVKYTTDETKIHKLRATAVNIILLADLCDEGRKNHRFLPVESWTSLIQEINDQTAILAAQLNNEMNYREGLPLILPTQEQTHYALKKTDQLNRELEGHVAHLKDQVLDKQKRIEELLAEVDQLRKEASKQKYFSPPSQDQFVFSSDRNPVPYMHRDATNGVQTAVLSALHDIESHLNAVNQYGAAQGKIEAATWNRYREKVTDDLKKLHKNLSVL